MGDLSVVKTAIDADFSDNQKGEPLNPPHSHHPMFSGQKIHSGKAIAAGISLCCRHLKALHCCGKQRRQLGPITILPLRRGYTKDNRSPTYYIFHRHLPEQ